MNGRGTASKRAQELVREIRGLLGELRQELDAQPEMSKAAEARSVERLREILETVYVWPGPGPLPHRGPSRLDPGASEEGTL